MLVEGGDSSSIDLLSSFFSLQMASTSTAVFSGDGAPEIGDVRVQTVSFVFVRGSSLIVGVSNCFVFLNQVRRNGVPGMVR